MVREGETSTGNYVSVGAFLPKWEESKRGYPAGCGRVVVVERAERVYQLPSEVSVGRIRKHLKMEIRVRLWFHGFVGEGVYITPRELDEGEADPIREEEEHLVSECIEWLEMRGVRVIP